MIFNFFIANLMTFSPKKKWSSLSFSFVFLTFVQNFKPNLKIKKKTDYEMCIWIVSITLSHFERITWIFVYDECHNHFWKKKKKKVSYLVLWIMNWWQSHLGLDAHLRRWQTKQTSKDECEFFNIQIRMNHLT